MKKLLALILFIQGVSAICGGEELIRTNGMGMPQSWLSGSPFPSFLIPGLILLFVIGGTSLTACYFMVKKNKYALEASAIAGFGIQIWIFAQISIIKQTSFLQIIYFSSGVLILALTIYLLKQK